MQDVKKGESWWFEFIAEQSHVPENIRYRRLLKYALRSLGLRCRRVSGRGPDADAIAAENAREGEGCQ